MSVEIVDFSQVLQQSTSGRSLGDEILASVVRSGIIAGSMVQRDVRADSTSVPGACQRWFAQPGNDAFFVGLSDEDAVGFTEVLFGAPAVRDVRSLSPVERRVLGTHLAIFLAPIAHAVERAIAAEVALVEATEPPDDADWLRFGVSFTIDDVALSCTIAARDRRPAVAGASGNAAVPPVEEIAVDAEVALRNIRMAWGALAGLRVGDVISCAITEDHPINAWVGDRLVFGGQVTAQDDQLVYEIQTTYLERFA